MTGASLDARIVVHRRHGRRAGSGSASELREPEATLGMREPEAPQGMTVRAHVHAAAGEAIALIGPSGAGKSTILHAIAGSVSLADGEVVIGTRVVATARRGMPAHRRGVVLLDQHARLFPHLTAGENVAFGLRAHGMGRAAADEQAAAWLDRVGLRQLGDRAPERLSGGQQQRVALARALAIEPALVLLDEPFTSLDVETAASVRALVQEQLALSGATAVIVTHAAEDAAALASRIVVVEDGRVAQQGALRAVLERPATRFAAAFADVNRIEGVVCEGLWAAGGALRLDARAEGATIADGAAAVVVRPADVRLAAASAEPTEHDHRATVLGVRHLPSGVRIVSALVGAAPNAAAVAADLDDSAAAALALRPGDRVHLSIDPRRMRLVRSAGVGVPEGDAHA